MELTFAIAESREVIFHYKIALLRDFGSLNFSSSFQWITSGTALIILGIIASCLPGSLNNHSICTVVCLAQTTLLNFIDSRFLGYELIPLLPLVSAIYLGGQITSTKCGCVRRIEPSQPWSLLSEFFQFFSSFDSFLKPAIYSRFTASCFVTIKHLKSLQLKKV